MNRAHSEFISALHEKHAEHMVRLTYRRVGDEELAKDIVQETFLTACFKVEDLFVHENPSGWLYKTVFYLCTREMGKSFRSKELPLDDSITLGNSYDLSLRYVLPQELSNEEKCIIIWRLEDELSYSQIAEKIGITEPACRKRFSRAIQRCREQLGKNFSISQSQNNDIKG